MSRPFFRITFLLTFACEKFLPTTGNKSPDIVFTKKSAEGKFNHRNFTISQRYKNGSAIERYLQKIPLFPDDNTEDGVNITWLERCQNNPCTTLRTSKGNRERRRHRRRRHRHHHRRLLIRQLDSSSVVDEDEMASDDENAAELVLTQGPINGILAEVGFSFIMILNSKTEKISMIVCVIL